MATSIGTTSDQERVQHRLEELVRKLHENESKEYDYSLGKILTIVDAAFTDPQQRKAVKDLIRNEYYNRFRPTDESAIQRLVRQLGESEGINIFPGEEKDSRSVPTWENPFTDIK